MLDVESSELQDGSAVNRVQEFVNYCKSQGVQVGLYTYKSFLEDYMNSNTLGLPLWIEEYNVSKPNIDIDYVGFQYSEKGQVSGINTNCDLDEFNEGIFLKEEEKKVENIVVYNYGPDAGAAEYLANFLNCPVITNSRKFDFSCVKNVYAVGGSKEQYSSYVKQVIAGADQYETMKEVLHFCGKLW